MYSILLQNYTIEKATQSPPRYPKRL